MGWPKGKPRGPRPKKSGIEERKPSKPHVKRSRLRTSEHAPGVVEAESVRQPKQPKPKKPGGNLRGIFDYRLPHACDLEDTVREAQERLGELYREAKAEGGPELVQMLKLGVKVRDPEKRDALIHKIATESAVVDWTDDAPRSRKAELEDAEPEGIQAGTSGLRGDSQSDAESGDGNGEAGDGEEGETFREVQQVNSISFLD